MIWQFEITDTFGGEANYSWVRRAYVTKNISQAHAKELAVRWAGWQGLKLKCCDAGWGVDIRPRGMAMVLFLSSEEPERKQGACIDHMVEGAE